MEKARLDLEDQVSKLVKDTAFADVKVDAKYHKHIIGKGGSTINKIKSEADVTINIPDTDSGATVIRIEGNKAGVEKAKAELALMVEKMENEKVKDLIVENRFHRQLIGAKGGEIEKIRKEFTAVQISFPDLGSKSDIVKLRGPKEDVDKCARHFNKLTKELLEQSGYQTKVPIFKQFHKFVIGKGGANIRRIRDETDTRIDLPDSTTDSDMITITGKKENVVKAVEAIQQIQSEMANIVAKEIMIPAKIHNTVIGAGGKLIQSIMSECGGVAIKFPENGSGSDKVTVRGPVNDVEKAIKLLEELSKKCKERKPLKNEDIAMKINKIESLVDVEPPMDWIKHAKIYFKTKKGVEKEDEMNLKPSSSGKKITKKIKKKQHQKKKEYSKQYLDIVKNTWIDERLEKLLEGGKRRYDQWNEQQRRLMEQLKKRKLAFSLDSLKKTADPSDADELSSVRSSRRAATLTRPSSEQLKEGNVQCYLSDIKERIHLLERCQLYHLQIQIHDIKTWVNEKTQVALDKSYYNLSNLQNKIQKHAVFEAEVAANKSHLMAINTKGEELCSTGHFASQKIASQLEDLASKWTFLEDTSKLKREKLHEANTALIFLHGLDELKTLLEEYERLLESGDQRNDLNSAETFILRHKEIKSKLDARKDPFQKLENAAKKILANKLFMFSGIFEKISVMNMRWENMQGLREEIYSKYLDLTSPLHRREERKHG